MKHSNITCPVYDEPMLPNEEGNCSLCNTHPESERVHCYQCEGKRRSSYPIDTKYKQNINEHRKVHI